MLQAQHAVPKLSPRALGAARGVRARARPAGVRALSADRATGVCAARSAGALPPPRTATGAPAPAEVGASRRRTRSPPGTTRSPRPRGPRRRRRRRRRPESSTAGGESRAGDQEAVDRPADHAREQPREDQRDARADEGEQSDQDGHGGKATRPRAPPRAATARYCGRSRATTRGPSPRSTRPAISPGDRRGAGALGDDPVCAREEADRLLDLGLGDRHDAATRSRTSSNVTGPARCCRPARRRSSPPPRSA